MTIIQSQASLHEKAVQTVARGDHLIPRQRRRSGPAKSSRVQVKKMHPAYKLAHDLGIPKSHVQITASGRFWGCIIHNHPAPWPER